MLRAAPSAWISALSAGSYYGKGRSLIPASGGSGLFFGVRNERDETGITPQRFQVVVFFHVNRRVWL
jgi:hypothetical protein